MRWRNSLLFLIILFPGLTLCALVGIVIFYALPLSQRPVLLWQSALVLGLIAFLGAVYSGLRLRRRLSSLCEFLSTAPERAFPPSLPVWKEDELGALERELQRLVTFQYDRLRTLQGERRKLAAVLQSMAEGVVVIDLAGNVVLCNRAAQDLFALKPVADWHGKPIQTFSRDPVLHELLREVARRRPSDQPATREMEIDSKEARSLEVSAMQICEDGAITSGYVLVFHDITQLKRLESIRADFVANVSHELRTPLTAIKGYAETLLNGALGDPETARRFLTIIDRHSERLSRLIEDLLTLSNLELGRTELRHEEILLPELVTEVFEVVREKAERVGVTLVADLPENLPLLTGDGDRLHQVLINLIDNSIKYTPAGGTVTVIVKPVRCGLPIQNTAGPGNGETREASLSPETSIPEREWLEIAVTDTGSGIPASEIPRLTQRFYRVDKARSRELGGTGLGLAIVKHIVQAHGGFLHIESQVHQGTTVRIVLPYGAVTLPVIDQTPSSV